MLKKVSIAFVAATVLVAVTPVVSAEAAAKVSNGVACTKSGATTKVGSFKYKCAKNPMVTNSKLTWLSVECISAATDYVAANKQIATVKAEVAQQLLAIDEDIKLAQADIVEVQAKLDAATARQVAATAKLAAAVTEADKKAYSTAIKSWDSAIKGYTSTVNRDNQSIKKLTNDKALLSAKPNQVVSNVADAKANAQLICQKGF